MRKVLIVIVIFAVIVSIVLISVSVFKHQDIAMNFDIMRDTTYEENQNNAANLGMMTANDQYICFFDRKYGLISYDINKGQYTILDTVAGTSWLSQTPNHEVYYNILQIQDGWLYYAKNNERNRVQTGIWRVDLRTGRKEKIPTDQYDIGGCFSVNSDFILLQSYADELLILKGNHITELASDVKGFAVVKGYIYYAAKGGIFKQNAYYKEDAEMLHNNNLLEKGSGKFYVNNDKIYFTVKSDTEPYTYKLYIIENDTVAEIESVQFKERPKFVFYKEYVVSDLGIYTFKWEQLVKFEFSNSIIPVIVGGNLYAFSPNEINLQSVGEGWYKIDVDQLVNTAKM